VPAGVEIVSEQRLVVSHPVSEIVEASDGLVDRAAVGSRAERGVESRHPEVVVVPLRREVAPEAEAELGDDLAWRDRRSSPASVGVLDRGVEETTRRRVGVVAPAVRALRSPSAAST